MRAGVIIAGGRSTRFGETDKAVAALVGVPMVRRVADRVAPTVNTVAVNCRAEQAPAIRDAMANLSIPIVYAYDERPDQGPLAGILTGLEAVEDARYAFVVACDMPFVDPAVVELLFEIAAGTEAAVPRIGDGWFQPTHAVYHVQAMAAACREALEAGDDRIVHALDRIECEIVEEDRIRSRGDLDTFENVNTREEFEAARTRLEADQDPT